MKEPPPLSRVRKRTSSSNLSSSKKLKLVCSFNGAFVQKPPSSKLRYIGGEARILSVDRNIRFLKLCSKISDLCPKSRTFTIRYQLPPVSPDSDSPLVLLMSDDDVRCMVEEHDKLEECGKNSRLWLFVCDVDFDCVTEKTVKNGNWVSVRGHNKNPFGGFNALGSESFHFDNRGVKKYLVNSVGVKICDEPLRKVVLKQQHLENQSGKVSSVRGVSRLGISESEVRHSWYDHPLVDLGPDQKCMACKSESRMADTIDYQLGSGRLSIGSGSFGIAQFPGLKGHPLNPRDGNRGVDRSGSMPCLLGLSPQVLCNSAGMHAGDVSQSVSRALNRENVMPFASGCGLVKTPLAAVYSSNQGTANAYAVKSSAIGNMPSCGLPHGVRNHKFVMDDSRNPRVHSCYMKNHQNNLNDAGSYRAARLDGKIPMGKCYPGVRWNSKILKHEHSARSCHSNSQKPLFGLPDRKLEHTATVSNSGSERESSFLFIQYANKKNQEQHCLPVSQNTSSYPLQCHLAYQGLCTNLTGEPLLSCNATGTPCASTVDALEDILLTSHYKTLQAPEQTLLQNFRGSPSNSELKLPAFQKDRFLFEPEQVSYISGISNTGSDSGALLGSHNKLLNNEEDDKIKRIPENKTHKLQNGIGFSVELLDNLSLSSSNLVEPPAKSPFASNNVLDVMLKPPSKPSDLMEGEQVNIGLQLDKPQEAENRPKHQKDDVHRQEVQEDHPAGLQCDERADIETSHGGSKIISHLSSGLAAVCARLGNRELQTIDSSDLECLKELGSGTYGTVFHGKWKGSDVAIKRLKPSCFAEGLKEQDRLIADFWKEAHILGLLHHPNIVAFYGVVRDGPVTNLATVTEYMVNGSLKQVLQRKDRTIDRRKRIILARDAAFGMEYLHEKTIVHFDLKSHNFLVNMRDPQRPICKIGDLGLSKIKQRTLVSGGVRGTIPWMAPELLSSKKVTEKVDVYSFGIVMWELLTGEKPYTNMRTEEIIAGIFKGTLRPEIPTWCDPAWRSLMESCWSSDPHSRPSFSEISKELRSMSAAMNIN